MLSSVARRARVGVIGLFWLNGAAWSSLVPRYPEIKASLELSNSSWGLLLALGPLGGIAAGLFTARLMRRFSSAGVAVAAQIAGICNLVILGSADVAWVFASALFMMSGLDALTDIAMNAHGLRVQKMYRRTILSSFHAWWSIGAVSGGLIGSAGAQARIPVLWQCIGAVVVFGLMSFGTRGLLLAGADAADAEAEHQKSKTSRRFPTTIVLRAIALGMLGVAAASVEDVGSSWGALFMIDTYQSSPFVAGLAFVMLQGTQTVGRFTGDRVIDRFGPRATVAWGAALTGTGMAVSLLVGNQWISLLGFSLAGLGIAVTIPAAMHAGDDLPGLAPGVGLTIVTWFLRLGLFASPPVIGYLGDLAGLRWALMIVPVAAVTMIVFSPALNRVEPVAKS